jgi:hypothetical protein
MPELDGDMGAAQLVLSTTKGNRGLNSCAHVEYVMDRNSTTFEMFGDFRKHFPALNVAATQKNLDALHARDFTPEAVAAVRAEAIAFYAAKKAAHRG